MSCKKRVLWYGINWTLNFPLSEKKGGSAVKQLFLTVGLLALIAYFVKKGGWWDDL